VNILKKESIVFGRLMDKDARHLYKAPVKYSKKKNLTEEIKEGTFNCASSKFRYSE
jgi:hypothetical protein